MVSRHDKCSFKKSTHVSTSAVQSCETDWIASTGVHPMACGWIAVNSHTLNQKQWTAASKYISNTLKYRLVNFQAKMQWELHRGSHCRQLYGAIRLCSWSCRKYVNSWLWHMSGHMSIVDYVTSVKPTLSSFHMKYKSAKQVSSPQSQEIQGSSPWLRWNAGAPSPAIKLILQCNETSIQDSSNQNMTHTIRHMPSFRHISEHDRACRWITSWKPDKCPWRKPPPPPFPYPGASLRWSEDVGVKLAQRSCITCWSFTSQTHGAME